MRKLMLKGLALLLIAASLVGFAMSALAVDDCGDGNHTIGYKDEVKATCTVDGYHTKYCTVCGKEFGVEIISHVGHKEGTEYAIINQPTCTTEGLRVKVCQVCGERISGSEQAIPALGHSFVWKTEREATCVVTGLRRQVCERCGYENAVEETALKEHTWGEWVTTREASCTQVGIQTRTCSVCGKQETRELAMLAHQPEWKIITAATCTAPGYQNQVCKVCGTVLQANVTIPATGHKMGAWAVTKEATCTEPGERVRTCSVCGYEEKETIPATGHSWGAWVVTKAADCYNPGERQRTCGKCGAVEKEAIPALNHPKTHWVIIKEATITTPGQRQLICDVCGDVIRTEVIPVKTLPNNTMCAFGPRLRDTELAPYNTDAWYMFTPFDASKDGVQTYELVASNMFIVGTVTIEVKEGFITVDYRLNSNTINVDLEFFTLLNRIQDIRRYEPEELMAEYGMKFREPISIEEEMYGDTDLVLYLCCRVTYSYDARTMSPLGYESAAHRALLQSMKALMD